MAALTFSTIADGAATGQAVATNRANRINIVGKISGRLAIQVAHADVEANYVDLFVPLSGNTTCGVEDIPVGWFVRVRSVGAQPTGTIVAIE